MKNHQVIVLVIALLTGNALHGQLVAQRIDKVDLPVTYMHLPMKPLPEYVKTYQSKIHPNGLSFKYIHLNKPLVYLETGTSNNYGSVSEAETDFLTIAGYERVAENADLAIDAYFSPIKVLSRKPGSASATFIENKKRVIRTVYFYDVEYTYHAEIQVVSSKGDTLFHALNENPSNVHKVRFGSSGQQDSPYPVKGASYTSPQILEDAYQRKFITQQEIDKTRKWLTAYKSYFDYNYARSLRTLEITIGKAKGRKYDYSALDQAAAIVREAFQMISEQGDQEEINVKLQSAIDIWNKELQTADYDKRRARINSKIAAMLKYNIGVAYSWMQQFEMSYKYFSDCKGERQAEKYAGRMKPFVKEYEARLKAN
jgi:hypothetical protein